MMRSMLTRWGWAALRRVGVHHDLVNLSLTEAAHRDAADAALEGVQRFAECLTNGLRIAGPSEKQ
jgi:hypothetical protein